MYDKKILKVNVKMKNKLYCSTGTIISRHNKYDYTLMNTVLSPIVKDLGLDGCEFMMLTAFYDKTDEIVEYMKTTDMVFPILHAEKEIGVLISEATDETDKEALRLFDVNCAFAEKLGAQRTVLHLWGGVVSDSRFEHNLTLVPKLCSIAENHGIELNIENIPCAAEDPISHWEAIHSADSRARFIYDTRFGEFHRQNPSIPKHPLFESGLVTHMHISDFIGNPKEFQRLRPILHPGEGQIDFAAIFAAIKEAGYTGSVTLESPVVHEDGSLDTDKLRNTLSFLKNSLA